MRAKTKIYEGFYLFLRIKALLRMLVEECYIRGAIFWELNKIWLINVVMMVICQILYLSQSNFELYLSDYSKLTKKAQDILIQEIDKSIRQIQLKVPGEEARKLNDIKGKLIFIEEIIKAISEKNPSQLNAKYKISSDIYPELRQIKELLINELYNRKNTSMKTELDIYFNKTFTIIRDANIINEVKVQEIVNISLSNKFTVSEKFDKLLKIISLNNKVSYYDINKLLRNPDDTDELYFERAKLSNGYLNYSFVDLCILSKVIGLSAELLLYSYLLVPTNLNFKAETLVECVKLIDYSIQVSFSKGKSNFIFDEKILQATDLSTKGVLTVKQFCTIIQLYYKIFELFDKNITEDYLDLFYRRLAISALIDDGHIKKFLNQDLRFHVKLYGCGPILLSFFEKEGLSVLTLAYIFIFPTLLFV